MTCLCGCGRDTAGEKFAGPGCRERLRRLQARETIDALVEELEAETAAEKETR